jgi:hypothetical protein
VEQRRGVIPSRVRVVARSYGVRALNARAREQERWRRVREGPRARRTSPEGGVQPSGEADLARGGVQPSSEADPSEGTSSP